MNVSSAFDRHMFAIVVLSKTTELPRPGGGSEPRQPIVPLYPPLTFNPPFGAPMPKRTSSRNPRSSDRLDCYARRLALPAGNTWRLYATSSCSLHYSPFPPGGKRGGSTFWQGNFRSPRRRELQCCGGPGESKMGNALPPPKGPAGGLR